MDKRERGEVKVHLTSEYLTSKFINQFDIVNHAIKLAENMILSGRGARVRIDVIGMNPANIVLEEIAQGKDYLEEMLDDDEDEDSSQSSNYVVQSPTNSKKEPKEKK